MKHDSTRNNYDLNINNLRIKNLKIQNKIIIVNCFTKSNKKMKWNEMVHKTLF